MKRLLAVVLALLLAVAPLSAAIAYVNSAVGADNSGTGAGTIATASASLTAGNLNVACIRYSQSVGPNISGVADTAGNTYSFGAQESDPIFDRLELWYVANALGSGSNVVTATFDNVGTQYRSIATAQYSGVALSGALDQTAIGTATSSPVTSASFTTTQGLEVNVVCGQVSASTSGATWSATGYTNRAVSDNVSVGDISYSSIQTGQTVVLSNSGSTGLVGLDIALGTFKQQLTSRTRRALLGVGK